MIKPLNPSVALSYNILSNILSNPTLPNITSEILRFQGAELFILKQDSEKISFWLNTYNSLYQLYLSKVKNEPSLISYHFFKYFSKFQIGHLTFTLNDIKQGILRLNQVKLGHRHGPFTSKNPRLSFAPRNFDNRIHFALTPNLSALAPTAPFTDSNLDFELGECERLYSSHNFVYDIEFQRIAHTELYFLYKSDFPERYLSDPDFKNFKRILIK